MNWLKEAIESSSSQK